MAAVFLFALAAGARLPSMRAALMIALYLSAGLVRRDPDAPTALSIAALIFLAVRPVLLLDTGFLRSFASVASILLFADPLARRMRALPRLLREPLGTSVSVQLLPFPIAIHAFHVLPVAAPLANLVVVPLLGVALWLCFLTSVLGFAAPPLALLTGHALAPVVWGIRAAADTVARMPFAHMTLTSPATPAAVLYWAALACVFRAGTHRTRRAPWAAGAVLTAAGTVLLWNPWQPAPSVDFLDVGHADAALVRTAGGDTVLIDGGVRSAFRDDGAYVIAPFLHARHVRRVDYLVATHAESDHMGGLLHVVERVPVGCVLLSAATPAPEKERPLLDRCAARGIPVRRMARGDTLDLRGARLEALHPPADWDGGRSINDYSLVLRLAWDGPSVLFAGDVEIPAERLLAAADCRAAVLKVPHHGSATSSSEGFLRAVAPAHAVISTRASGRGAAVAPAVERRFAELGITIWRTDHHGGLRLAERGGQWVFEGARTARGYR
jgi:competence protein ComEC